MDLRAACLAAAASLALPGITAAQDAGTDRAAAAPGLPVISTQSSGPALVFTLRGGVGTAPEYFGSDEYEVVPDLGFGLRYARLGGLEFGDPDPWAASRGFGFRGSFNYIGERDADDYDELDGLDDIDAAVELGFGVGYTERNWSVFADIRRGFGGHEAVVGEIGGDIIVRPSEALMVTFGPRLFYGADGYADTYFGVSADEAAASPTLTEFDAEGGLLSAGVELGMRYKLNENWGIEGAVTWDQFTHDAEDSPIVRQGDRDQWGARIGLTRVFRVGG
ncbi:MipA/OmpV family protein [Roseivivax isoporae]|uniref:MipA/OmpV family protein n=1 Tax=Roseivivax isoporae TaxID=591206 RepID=UPI0004B2C087|nr:MipA/OmpV family protein [Roseivivax isoporae]